MGGFRRCGRRSYAAPWRCMRGSHVRAMARRGRRAVGDEMPYEGEQGLHTGTGDPCGSPRDRDLRREVDRGADLLGVVAIHPVELVDRDDESAVTLLEEVHGGEAEPYSAADGSD